MRTGLHANDTRDHAKIVDYYRRSGANVFKTLVYHDDLLTELDGMGVTIIGRIHESNQQLGGSAATAFIRKVVESAQRHPQVDFWEGYNEEFAGRDEIARYAEHEIERMRALEAIGRKAAIGCFSTGTPEVTDAGVTWGRFRPALEHALANGHALALHEYAGPYMQYFTRTPDGRNQWNSQTNSFTGISPDPKVYWNPALDGWLTLRYRQAYALFKTWGLGTLRLFITEGGIDDTTPRPGPGGKGYKAFRDGTWDKLPGIGDYAEQRRWYMWHVTYDDYVGGVVDFGWDGTPTGWPDFDLATDAAMVNRIIEQEQTLPQGHGRPPAPGEQPPPPPPPPPTTRDILGPLPMVVVKNGTLLDVARHVYPNITNATELERKARAIATANGLDYAALQNASGDRPLLPRYLLLPDHMVVQYTTEPPRPAGGGQPVSGPRVTPVPTPRPPGR